MTDRQSWIAAGEAFNVAVYGDKYLEYDRVTTHTAHDTRHTFCARLTLFIFSCLTSMQMTAVWTILFLRFFNFHRVCLALEEFKKAPSRPSLTRSTVDLVTPLRWFNLQGPEKLGERWN